MWKILHESISNYLKIIFTSRPRTGIKAVVPSLRRGVAAYHQSLYDNSFAVIGPRLWNCLPGYINKMEEFESFKIQLTSLLRQIHDQPPVKGYTSSNTNSILEWRKDPVISELWGGRDSWWPCCRALNPTKGQNKRKGPSCCTGQTFLTTLL